MRSSMKAGRVSGVVRILPNHKGEIMGRDRHPVSSKMEGKKMEYARGGVCKLGVRKSLNLCVMVGRTGKRTFLSHNKYWKMSDSGTWT